MTIEITNQKITNKDKGKTVILKTRTHNEFMILVEVFEDGFRAEVMRSSGSKLVIKLSDIKKFKING